MPIFCSEGGDELHGVTQHFIFQLMHTMLKNIKLVKHFKIRKLLQHVLFTRKPSSGGHNQYLAKITCLVQCVYVELVQWISVVGLLFGDQLIAEQQANDTNPLYELYAKNFEPSA